jgi:hypothetical protein
MHVKDQCNSACPETQEEQPDAQQRSQLAANSAVLQEDVSETKCLCTVQCEPAASYHKILWLLTTH